MREGEEIARREQFHALVRVVQFRPVYFLGVVLGGVFAALLEGVGLGFIVPIVELVRSTGDPASRADGLLAAFVGIYQFLGVPFTLGTAVVGVSVVLTVRWTATFVVRWIREALVVQYTRHLQERSFERALDARVAYFDREGSDDVLNAIVTQAEYAGRAIRHAVDVLEQLFITLLYLSVALALAPLLTLVAIVFLGGLSYLLQNLFEPGSEIGEEVAAANERIQSAAQAGTQGIRETKLYDDGHDLYAEFLDALDQFSDASVRMSRNKQAIGNFYNLFTAVSVFALVYLAIEFANMSLGALGAFLFAMFRLGPKASNLNSKVYSFENNVPHLVRTQEFLRELERNREPTTGSRSVPERIRTVEFDDVGFSYAEQDETVVDGIDFHVEKGEFVGFAGQSGAGKSTIAALLARLYEPDSGDIRVNGISIAELDVDEYRSKLAVVRQDPYVFNDTLRYNLTVGNRAATDREIDRVCRIARVDEFLDELPDGYDTPLGDAGVRLSGGQRQRVALARALLKDDAELLVLDEATSDLDSRLGQQVQSSIECMDREFAIIGIAHRLSTLRNADRIYTLESGRVVEVGDHAQLVDRDGIYSELFSIQSQTG